MLAQVAQASLFDAADPLLELPASWLLECRSAPSNRAHRLYTYTKALFQDSPAGQDLIEVLTL